MSKFVFSEPKNYFFTKAGHSGKKFDIASVTATAEVLIIDTKKGHEQVLKEHVCDFLYYVLKGKGSFIVENQENMCQKGDLVVIPSGTQFTFKGKLTLLLFITPPFTSAQEEIIQ